MGVFEISPPCLGVGESWVHIHLVLRLLLLQLVQVTPIPSARQAV